MAEGFFHLESVELAGRTRLEGPGGSRSKENTGNVRAVIGWLPIIVILAAAAWLLMADHGRRAESSWPVRLAIAAAAPSPGHTTVGLTKGLSFDPLTSEAITPDQPAPIDGMNISSQSWRRGGLGSNAFVTLTLRNDNDYAVKDVGIFCAFARPDGSHLTDRTRWIHDTVSKKSRKTFAHLHVGFVNINASRTRCSLLAASHI